LRSGPDRFAAIMVQSALVDANLPVVRRGPIAGRRCGWIGKVAVAQTTSPAIRVAIVDDHRMTAFSLRDSLESRGIEVVAVEHKASDAARALAESGCNVLVTDLDLGVGPTGIDLALLAKRRHPQLGVVLLTAYEDPKLLEPSFPLLPRSFVYLVKQQLTRSSDLTAAIGLALAYARGDIEPPERRRFPLTMSQAKILRLVARGLSNQAIADELSMTLDSVNTSIKRLARTLGIRRETGSNLRVLLTQHFFDLIGYSRER